MCKDCCQCACTKCCPHPYPPAPPTTIYPGTVPYIPTVTPWWPPIMTGSYAINN